jgi:hypothetical protein
MAQGERRPLLCALHIPPRQDAHRHQGLCFLLHSLLCLSSTPAAISR